jgi:hypothetical protein
MSVRRNATLTVSFKAVDPTLRPYRKSGLVIANTDIWISKDGGNFANATNGATELTGVLGRYSIVLTAAEMDASWVHIVVVKAGMDDADMVLGTAGSPSGQAIAGTLTTSTFTSDRAEATDDYWKDAIVLFTSGGLAGQVKKVSAYTGVSKLFTVNGAFTAAPVNGDRFILINI